MARWLLLLCLSLAACGGGGSSGGDNQTPPPPTCCESTALIAADFDAEEQAAQGRYDNRRANTESGRAANGTYFSGAHLTDIRDTAILAATEWTDAAYAIVDGYAQSYELDGPAIADLVEDHRASMLAYILADYDDFTSHPNWANNQAAVQQTRQELIDGVNAEFDALQVALADAGYT